jgi:outer membrane lipoprotein-sorting protein
MNRFLRSTIAAAFGLTVMLGFGAINAEAQILREILNRMDTHYKALQSLEANVTRRQVNSQIGTSEEQSGSIVLVPQKKASFMVRLDWTRPRAETLTVANGKYQMYIPAIKTAYRGSTKSQQANKAGGGVLSILTMSEAERRANFNVRYLGQVSLAGDQVWHLQLDPKTKQSFKSAELWVNTDGMPVQGKVVAHNNDTDTIQLKVVNKNQKIDSSKFKVTPARGTNVIES